MTLHICLAGVESTGKTTLGMRAARRFSGMFLPEYGREYAETIGTEFSPFVLRSIAKIHEHRRERLLATMPRLLVEDTDVVMTSAWFTMLHGHRDPALSTMPAAAEVYLLFAPDTPWVADGTRQFVGRDRIAFQKIILSEMAARGISPIIISGNWEQRRDALSDIITARLDIEAASGS